MAPIPKPEFSRVTPVSDIPDEGITLALEATAAEREALARRFDVIAIDSLTAEVSLRPEQDGTRLNVAGRLRAEVVQRCVVTLNPVAVDNDVSFERTYATTNTNHGTDVERRSACEVVLTLDEDDPPEPLPSGILDVGEAVAEEFALSLDPFPRAPNAVFEGYAVGPHDQRELTNAFAALAVRHNTVEKKG